MWYIFPQIQGLGFSESAKYYAVRDIREAAAYLAHPILGARLETIARELLKHKDKTAQQIFGSPDDLKLRSSMTLFAALPAADPVFSQVIDQFFKGESDLKTQHILGMQA